ncbi:MAG: cupin domain-containing protein [Novosphingobium sp.]|nr:cupin domain-containing protein [Novosphingobium sp.]
MAITFTPHHFTGRDAAVAEIEASGLRLAEAELSQAELTGAAHSHPYRVDIYLLEGVLELHEPDTGLDHRLEPGSMAIVPAGTRHAESCPGQFRAVFGVSVDPEVIMAGREPVAGLRQL